MTPLTPEHREAFESSLEYWQGELNLRDWRVNLSKKPTGRKVLACVEIDWEAAICKVMLPKVWPIEVTPAELDSTALHELLHVMLAPLLQASRARDDEATATIEHRVIQVLERLLAERRK